MPPLAPVPAMFRVRLIFTVGEDVDITSNLHFGYSGGPPTPADCVSIAGSIAGLFTTDLAPLMFTGNTLNEVRVTDLTSSSASDGLLAANHPGTRAGSFLPAGACLLSNYTVARRYRGGKPRTYFPFGVQGDLLDGQKWTTAFLSACNSGLNNFITACFGVSSGTTQLSGFFNISYYSGFTSVQNPVTKRYRNVNTPRATPLKDPIQSIVANPKLGYQRRRAVR